MYHTYYMYAVHRYGSGFLLSSLRLESKHHLVHHTQLHKPVVCSTSLHRMPNTQNLAQLCADSNALFDTLLSNHNSVNTCCTAFLPSCGRCIAQLRKQVCIQRNRSRDYVLVPAKHANKGGLNLQYHQHCQNSDSMLRDCSESYQRMTVSISTILSERHLTPASCPSCMPTMA